MMSPDYFAAVNGNILCPAKLSFISLSMSSVLWELCLWDWVPFPLLFKAWVFLLCWKTFRTINPTIIDCHVARMIQRLKAAEIQFFESVFYSYKPNTFNFGSHEVAPEQQAQTQEQWGTFPCKSHKDTICTTAGAGSRNTQLNPGLIFRLC